VHLPQDKMGGSVMTISARDAFYRKNTKQWDFNFTDFNFTDVHL
jgi:hypothetical protein